MESKESFPGSRQSMLKKSLNRNLRSLLTTCSIEKFREAFPTFTALEQERIYQFFAQIISSEHQCIEEDFESLFLDAQVGALLNTVEELVEEQTLDPLHFKSSNVGEVIQKLLEAKKNEVNHLTGLLEKAEEQNHEIKARVEQLKKEKQDFSGATKLVNELRTIIGNYETGDCTSMPTS